jgi:hypothetical protein
MLPLMSADHPPAPDDLRQALATIDHHVTTYCDNARLNPVQKLGSNVKKTATK